jgi:hypothetical protein
VSRFLSPAVQALMDTAHAEGRPEFDDTLADGAGGGVLAGGLAAVDDMLAGLWR